MIASTNEIILLYNKNKDENNLCHIDKSLNTKILKKKIIIGNKKKSREPKNINKLILKIIGSVVLFLAFLTLIILFLNYYYLF